MRTRRRRRIRCQKTGIVKPKREKKLSHNSSLRRWRRRQRKQQRGREGHNRESLEVHIQILIEILVKVHNLMGPRICETKHNRLGTLLNSRDLLSERMRECGPLKDGWIENHPRCVLFLFLFFFLTLFRFSPFYKIKKKKVCERSHYLKLQSPKKLPKKLTIFNIAIQ
jgi:hypothetical protein